MKSIKLLLAAFAVSAMFAACTKEEAPVAQNLQQDQFVGAELIGTNVSVNFGTYTDTKVDGLTGDFEEGDKIGLGWIVTNAGYTADQKPTASLVDPALFANHMYIKENGELVTKGNMYKGWHFAYMPFQYVEKLGQALKVTVNPVQTEDYTRDAVNTNFNVSGRNFLTRESLDDNYQLKEGISFPIARATNTIKVTVKPTAMFTGSDALKNLKIKSIQIKAKEKIFPDATITLHPQYLPALTEESTKSDVYDALPSVMASAKANTTITSTIDNEDIDLSGDQALRIYTLPVAGVPVGGVTPKNVVFTIGVEGGVFTVPYVTDEESEQYSETNKESIEAFVEAYEEDGVLTEYGTSTLKIELELNGAMFAPAFGAISSESEWNNAIAVADALGIDNPEFTLVNDVDEDGNYDWEFTDDIKLLANTANDTKDKVKVKVNGNIVLGEEMTWPAKGLDVSAANIVVNSDLRVENTLDPASLVNNAIITVGPNGIVKNLDNSNAEVIAEYGAYVYPATGKEGTIAYVVDDVTPAGIHKVNTMLKNKNVVDQQTSINTLIVKAVLDLNAPAVPDVDGDRYDEGHMDFVNKLTDLSQINFILEDGSLVHKLAGPNTTVKHIVARVGENTIDDVVVNDDIHTAESAVLNVNNSVAVASKPYTTGAINNEGTLNSNVAFLMVDDVENSNGTINVANGSYILYNDTYTQGGSVKGWVLKKVTSSDAKESDMEYNPTTRTYDVNSALGLVKLAASLQATGFSHNVTINLNKDIDMAGIYWTGLNFFVQPNSAEHPHKFNGNGHTIKNLSGNSGLFVKSVICVSDLTIDGASIYTDNKYAGVVSGTHYGSLTNVVVKNATLTGNEKTGSYGAIAGHAVGVVDGCEVENANVEGGKRVAGIAALVNEANVEIKNSVVSNSKFSYSPDSKKADRAIGAIVGEFDGNGGALTFTLNKCSVVNTTPANLYGKATNVKKLNVK